MINLYVKELENRPETKVPITASIVCKRGEYNQIGVNIGGEIVPCQVNVLATYDDRSIKHALVTFYMNFIGQKDHVHTISLDPDQTIVPESFPIPKLETFNSLSVKLEMIDNSDNVWIVDIPNELTWPLVRTAATTDLFSPRLHGPLAEEIEWRQPFHNIVDHPNLSAVIRWRMYSKSYARIECVIENSQFPNMDDVDVKSLKIWTGDSLRLTLNNEKIRAGTRAREITWAENSPPKFITQQDASYLREMGVIPLVDTSNPISDAEVANFYSHWLQTGKVDPLYPDGKHFRSSQITSSMGNTGDRADIGNFPYWALCTVNSLSELARLGQSSADGNGSATYPVHLRDASGCMGLPRSARINRAHGGDSGPYKPDRAHQPCLAFPSYILTGERFYEEELSAWATYCTREWPWTQAFRYVGSRDCAWTLRTCTNAAFILPDDHPYKQYLLDTIEFNLQDWIDKFINASPDEYPLHTMSKGGWQSSGRKNWSCAGRNSPWQYYWKIWALYHCWKLLGYQEALDLFNWCAVFPQELYVNQLGATYTTIDGQVITWDPRYGDQYSFAISKHEPEIVNGQWQKKPDTAVMLTNAAECLWQIHVNESWGWNNNNFPPLQGPPENWLPNPPDFRKSHSTFEEYAMGELAPVLVEAGVAGANTIWSFIEPYVDAKINERNWPPGMKQVP